jgi:hypothetical protein
MSTSSRLKPAQGKPPALPVYARTLLRPRLGFGLALLLGLGIRLGVAAVGVEVADVQRMHEVAEAVLAGQNPYLRADFYVYPPPWMFVEAGSLLLSRWTGIPFPIVIKSWPTLADLGIAALVRTLLMRRGLGSARATAWALAYLFNPVSITITAAHGQFDALPSLLSLLALAWLAPQSGPRHWRSALALGAAIALKPFPVLLVPWYASAAGPGIRRLQYLLLAGLPVAVSLVPFLGPGRDAMLQSMLGYSGVYDLGYGAVLRAAWLVKTGSYWLPGTIGQDLAQMTKLAFGASYLLLFLLFARRPETLEQRAVLTYLLFLTVFTGLSAQYLSWLLPFAVLARDRRVFPYSLGATAALIGFYLVFWPAILLGRWNHFDGIQRQFGVFYLGGTTLAWLAAATWLCGMVISLTRAVTRVVSVQGISALALAYHSRGAVVLGLAILGVGPAVPLIIAMVRALIQ